jgi:hypothetical protein
VGILAALLLFISCMYQPTIQERICEYDWDCDTALAVFTCESNLGQHPDTYNVDHPDGGVTQLNKATWGWWFAYYYGWTWEQIVLNDDLNLAAAYIIYQRAGNTFLPWSCYG